MRASSHHSVSSPAELRARLDWDDARLLAECDIHLHRTGGPGGQHRNKVETAVRLVHRPSGLAVTAGETRSQHENKAKALWRLREALATSVRLPPSFPLRWPDGVQIRDEKLRISESNLALHHALALTLDSFAYHGGRLSEAATSLGVTSSSLTRFLAEHARAWTEAQRIRREAGLAPLKTG